MKPLNLRGFFLWFHRFVISGFVILSLIMSFLCNVSNVYFCNLWQQLPIMIYVHTMTALELSLLSKQNCDICVWFLSNALAAVTTCTNEKLVQSTATKSLIAKKVSCFHAYIYIYHYISLCSLYNHWSYLVVSPVKGTACIFLGTVNWTRRLELHCRQLK